MEDIIKQLGLSNDRIKSITIITLNDNTNITLPTYVPTMEAKSVPPVVDTPQDMNGKSRDMNDKSKYLNDKSLNLIDKLKYLKDKLQYLNDKPQDINGKQQQSNKQQNMNDKSQYDLTQHLSLASTPIEVNTISNDATNNTNTLPKGDERVNHQQNISDKHPNLTSPPMASNHIASTHIEANTISNDANNNIQSLSKGDDIANNQQQWIKINSKAVESKENKQYDITLDDIETLLNSNRHTPASTIPYGKRYFEHDLEEGEIPPPPLKRIKLTCSYCNKNGHDVFHCFKTCGKTICSKNRDWHGLQYCPMETPCIICNKYSHCTYDCFLWCKKGNCLNKRKYHSFTECNNR